MVRFRVLFDLYFNQRVKQCFSSLADIMNELEETQIERKFFL